MHVRNVCAMAMRDGENSELLAKRSVCSALLAVAPPPTPHTEKIYIMKFGKTVSTALVMSALLVAASGCQKNEDQAEQAVKEGLAEHAGQEVDEAVAKVGEKIEQAGENIQDAAKGGKD